MRSGTTNRNRTCRGHVHRSVFEFDAGCNLIPMRPTLITLLALLIVSPTTPPAWAQADPAVTLEALFQETWERDLREDP